MRRPGQARAAAAARKRPRRLQLFRKSRVASSLVASQSQSGREGTLPGLSVGQSMRKYGSGKGKEKRESGVAKGESGSGVEWSAHAKLARGKEEERRGEAKLIFPTFPFEFERQRSEGEQAGKSE